MARAFCHVTLVQSVFTLPVVPNPHSRSKRELVLPSLGLHFDHFCQVAVDWQEKEVLSEWLFSELLQNLGSGTLSQIGAFAFAPVMFKTASPSRLKAPSSDSIKSDFSDHCKLFDLLSVQLLKLFLQHAAEKFQSAPPLPFPQGHVRELMGYTWDAFSV